MTVFTNRSCRRFCRSDRHRSRCAAYGRNGWLGLASINITGGTHITAGTTKVNDTYVTMPQYNTPDERAHVMCQEMGHDFGLGHTSEDGSSQQTCMDYSTDPSSTSPNAHDYAQLESIYAHLDSTSTVGATSPSKLRGVGDDASTWGKLIHTLDQELARRHHGQRLRTTRECSIPTAGALKY